ncbi:MAG: DUF115 domain-containing protein [Treponema sp.]|nr:DUF115 domain-containing protein [Treponema sp.]
MIEFKPAKNEELTASADGILLHSGYNPSKEAERYAENLQLLPYENILILIEPAISYAAKFIKKKYPDIKLGAIRFSSDFNKYNDNFDFIINFNSSFNEKLFSLLGEEGIYQTHFSDWEASKKVFPEEYKKCIFAIKECMEKSKTLLVTREYFEKKWFSNSLNFIKYLKNPITLKEKINRDVLILASGPSLKAALPYIKEYQDKYFIIVLSSAIRLALENNIKADLTMSTDGGYWAGEHLKHIPENWFIALSPESWADKKLLASNYILPLNYGDGISSKLLSICGFTKYIKAERNGTVSGTALSFALSNSLGKIYIFGLDMANSKGFQHSQPNELEINNSLKDFRLLPCQSRLYKSEIAHGSLDIYLQWFEERNFEKDRVYRIIDNPKNQLGKIKDISSKNFFEICMEYNISKKQGNEYFVIQEKKSTCLKKLTENEKLIFSEKNIKQLFPLSNLSINHNPDNKEVKERLENEVAKLKRKFREICNE